MNWTLILKNWRTSLGGIAGFLFSVPIFVGAIQDWAAGRPVNWKYVLVSLAITAFSGSLLNAKDAQTHSTEREVFAATTAASAPKTP
jgi:hypothetical protein